jgi:hypothetical protein
MAATSDNDGAQGRELDVEEAAMSAAEPSPTSTRHGPLRGCKCATHNHEHDYCHRRKTRPGRRSREKRPGVGKRILQPHDRKSKVHTRDETGKKPGRQRCSDASAATEAHAANDVRLANQLTYFEHFAFTLIGLSGRNSSAPQD